MTDEPDRHSTDREKKQRKRKYGMRVSGTSVRTLAKLVGQKKKRRKK